MTEARNVIALISGGKDSFFSLLHCIRQGHRIVALANLYPLDASPSSTPTVQTISPDDEIPASGPTGEGADPTDLNSFMYQTVGHEVIPLYAAATGIPLYRYPIVGGAVRRERDYHYGDDVDGIEETEAMVPLLRFIKGCHPDADALCAGAILSTYQRTRVESIALRLALVPLAYLWQYPCLPGPAGPIDDTQLLLDMGSAGLEARIVKVASAGLDERHLWMRVTAADGVARVKAALRKFGVAQGAALGEGGEFETMVLDGPRELFRKRIVVPEAGRRVVHEDGGTSWLLLKGSYLEEKSGVEHVQPARTPDPFDERFKRILEELTSHSAHELRVAKPTLYFPASRTVVTELTSLTSEAEASFSDYFFAAPPAATIEDGMVHVVNEIRTHLSALSLDASHIINTIIVLRNMSDFGRINAVYGKLFSKPNPPARVTISCGDLLPEGCDLAVAIVAPRSSKIQSRDGLHVQSQSYWAPANIGPYSQAIGASIAGQQGNELRVVSIAGQIPLVPASMTFPPDSSTALQEQIVLSLQHLWRIGSERKVQYWASAVAYFSRQDSDVEMETRAILAGCAWQKVHETFETEDDLDEQGPDLWDRTHNPQYMTLGGIAQEATTIPLPDVSILPLRQQNEPDACVPPFFAVEMEELPRQAAVEWHAHLGLLGVADGQAEHVYEELDLVGWKAWHTVIRTPSAIFLHSVVYCGLGAAEKRDLRRLMLGARRRSLQSLGMDVPNEDPYLTYVDVTKFGTSWDPVTDETGALRSAMIPCRSIWTTRGEKLGLIALYRTTMRKEST